MAAAVYHIWQPSNVQWLYGVAPEHVGTGAAGSVLTFFDFDLIPLGATTRLTVTGMSRSGDGDLFVRAAAPANWNDATGTLLASASVVGGIGVGTPVDFTSSFANALTGWQVLKLTGFKTSGGSLLLDSLSIILQHD